jgi:ubiquinone/menaquinone biosynthesis C-methylase UbiE
MSVISDFTQPESAPEFFIQFLDSMDRHAEIRAARGDTIQRMALVPGDKVLDVGCGLGGVTFPLAKMTGPSGLVAGIDIRPAFVETADRRAAGRPGIEFRVGDAGSIPYPDDFFDAAHSERVFLYLTDRLAAIEEMKRVVKPGGRLWLLDADADSMAIYSNDYALTRKMLAVFAATLPNPYSARELPILLKQAGLREATTDVFAISAPHEVLTRAFTATLMKAAESGELSRADVDDWLGEQAALHASGDFFCTWLMTRCSGTV